MHDLLAFLAACLPSPPNEARELLKLKKGIGAYILRTSASDLSNVLFRGQGTAPNAPDNGVAQSQLYGTDSVNEISSMGTKKE